MFIRTDLILLCFACIGDCVIEISVLYAEWCSRLAVAAGATSPSLRSRARSDPIPTLSLVGLPHSTQLRRVPEFVPPHVVQFRSVPLFLRISKVNRMVLALASTARAAVQCGGIAVRSHARQTPRASPASSFLAGRSLRSATSNRTEIKTAAFFNFGKKNNDYSESPPPSRHSCLPFTVCFAIFTISPCS
jgi:hypothetical protein